MPKGLSEKERTIIVALAEASTEALHATDMRLKEKENKGARASAPVS